MATSSYCLSTFLYHAEFVGLPPDADAFMADVGRSVAPSVPLPLLYGRPADGSFGVLPVVHHVRARHVTAATRLLHQLLQPAPARPLWTYMAEALLRSTCPDLHPAQTLLLPTLAQGLGDAGLVAAGDLCALTVPQPQPPVGCVAQHGGGSSECGPCGCSGY